MAPPPNATADKNRSLVYFLLGIFFVLVLIEKSLGVPSQGVFAKDQFRNIGKSTFQSKPKTDPLTDKEWEDDLAWEEEALEPIPVGDDIIPVVDSGKEDHSSIEKKGFQETKPLAEKASYIPVYFLKFYGQGKKSQSQLVKVTREFSGGDPIPFILTELIKGPNLEEKEKAVLNAIPKKLRFKRGYRIENGILHLSLSSDIEYGGSPEILKDRMDQICFSFIGNFGITGLKIYVEDRKLKSLGGDGLPLPEILVRENRKTIIF